MTAAGLVLETRIIEDVAWKEDGIPLCGGHGYSVDALMEKMERTWKSQIELTVATVMGTSFKVKMSPQETVLDIKRRIYFREGDQFDNFIRPIYDYMICSLA